MDIDGVNELFKIVDADSQNAINYVGISPLSWEDKSTLTKPKIGFQKINPNDEDVIQRKAVKIGNSSHVVLPRDWRGDDVICIRVSGGD